MTAGKTQSAVAPEEVYNVVAGATSQDPALVSASAARLKQLLDMPGTFDCLSAISAQRSMPNDIRRQAIIQFKNNALNHWRVRRLATDAQKAEIRGRCLLLLDETDDVIADCNKIIIAKIGRTDYPHAWQDLIPNVVNSIDSALNLFLNSGGSDMRSTLVLIRSLDVLNYVIKEFASIKMPMGIKTMGYLVETLHLKVQGYYSSLSSSFPNVITSSSISNRPTADALISAHLVFKCLSRMAVWAWHRTGLNSYAQFRPWVEAFFENSAVMLRVLEELRIGVVSSLDYSPEEGPADRCAALSIDYLTRHIRQYGKLFRRMQQLSCARFVALNTCGSLVLYYWSKVVQATHGPPEGVADSQYAIFPVRFLVQAMALFKESLGQWSLTKKGPNGTATFSREFVEEAVKLLVTRFIPLKPKDLDAWLTDPEEWVNAEDKENDQWEYELRPCGERVLMALANQYRDFVTPLLKATFDQVVGHPASDLGSILQKEALYCSIGRCARWLVKEIPFQDWVSQSLAAEAKDPNPNYPILKRRIAWVLGKLTNDECITPNVDIWSILLHLLTDKEQGSDQVVRLTAASALRECVASLRFNADNFIPFLPGITSQLLELTAEADTLDSKRRVLQTLTVIIESVGEKIVPYMAIIAKSVPQLWTSAEGDFLFKATLLQCVTKLAESSKQHSISLNPIIVPLLHDTFSDNLRTELDEDGLDLWKISLRNAVTLDSVDGGPSLLQLFPLATALLSENFDLLGSIATIIRSYLVLGATGVIQAFATPLFNAFEKAYDKALPTNQKDIITLSQLIAQLTPAQLWAEAILSSGFFSTLISNLMDEKGSTLLLTEHVFFFARVALNEVRIISQLISVSATNMNKPESELWNGLLDQWWRRFDNMSDPRCRKLAAMGIACLVAEGRPEVLERLNGEVFNLWLDVFGEMKEALAEMAQDNSQDALSTLSPLITFWKDNGAVLPSTFDGIEGTPEYERWRQIYQHDPVETQKLTTFVALKLQQTYAMYGPAFESTYLKDTDPGVLKQLRDELGS